MKIPVISDIQGKYDQLREFYSQLNGHDPRNVHVLGDVLEFGVKMDDNLCVDLVREKGSKMVLGNHEGFAMMRYMTRSQRKTEEGTIDLDEDMFNQSIDYFNSLPDQIVLEDMLFTHAIPDDKLKIKRLIDAEKGFEYLENEHPDISVCFIGHSHVPVTFSRDQYLYTRHDSPIITLDPNKKYIINPGALEDGHYLIFDTETKTVERKTL